MPVPREWLLELLAGPPETTTPNPAATAVVETEDRLLGVEETAARLGVTKDWLYHHRKDLPFAVKLGPRVLRFSAVKLERYLETRRRGSVA